MHNYHDGFDSIARELGQMLINASPVDVGEWQSQRGGPESMTVELEDVSLRITIPPSIEALADAIRPNLPWAEEHFQERVSGVPYNPPPSAERWPFKRAGHAEHLKDNKFSHTYPERLWPNAIEGLSGDYLRNSGIRFGFGDLGDVVNLLVERPFTRQAYIPIWFPEDTGAHHGERVPCTLGYHVMMRKGRLKIVYYIRSCDYLRHFRDDVYMAGRLCQWLVRKINEQRSEALVEPGDLIMHISSLHVFSADVPGLVYRRRLGKL